VFIYYIRTRSTSTLFYFKAKSLSEMSYDDDYYHPTSMAAEENEFNEYHNNHDDDTVYSSVSSNRKKQRKLRQEMKKADKGFNSVKRVINYKPTDIEFYTTKNSPGNMIRDAITGNRYNEYRVGSISEHLFFKVKISTGELDYDAGVLFFDSPEQYEKHFKNIYIVSRERKEYWTNKCARFRKIIEKQ
jgi:hypothetical protein